MRCVSRAPLRVVIDRVEEMVAYIESRDTTKRTGRRAVFCSEMTNAVHHVTFTMGARIGKPTLEQVAIARSTPRSRVWKINGTQPQHLHFERRRQPESS